MVIPASMVRATFLASSRNYKLGKKVEAGVVFNVDHFKLLYAGPQTYEELWPEGAPPTDFVDMRSGVVQKSRIMITRPIFNQWALDVSILINESVIDENLVEEIFKNAGIMCRLGTARVLGYGSFSVERVPDKIKKVVRKGV